MTDLNSFMAAVRYAKSGSWEGDYHQVERLPDGRRVIGAYGILENQWSNMAAYAGLEGADWRNRSAQDYVAGQIMGRYQQQYGSWDLVAAAWMGGAISANRIMYRGYNGVESIKNEQIRQFVGLTQQNLAEVPNNLPRVAPEIKYAGGNWIFPVAGENNWKPGGFMYKRTPGQVAAGRTRIHEGIDIGAKKGTPVVAPASGKVVTSTFGGKGGHQVKIMGDDGIIYFFSHLDGRTVKKGQRLDAGYVIGAVGNSGNAKTTKPHLHFTMKQAKGGALINPTSYLQGGNSMPGAIPVTAEQPAQQPIQEKMNERMTGMFSSMSNLMAGGQRVDYRSMTNEDQAQMQTNPDQIGVM
jgi:murein DD-endopeptidase MepM/ murein hydrolase activator NlpD